MANPYYIKIELPETSQSNNAVSGATASTESGSGSDGELSAKSVLQTAKKVVAVTGLAATADKLVSYPISHVSLATGASEYQQRLESVYSIAKQAGGAALSIAMGAATGTLPIVLIGLAVSGTQKLIDIAQKEQELNTQRVLESISIGMATVRAGTSGRRGANQ